MNEVVEVCFPAEDDLVVLGRMTAGAVGVRAGFSIEEVEDLRLAVDELCLWVLSAPGGASLVVRFERDGSTVHVQCSRSGPPTGHVQAGTGTDVTDVTDVTEPGLTQRDLSRQIIEALVDEGGAELADGPRPSRIRITGSGAAR
jgi:hypothetical protein